MEGIRDLRWLCNRLMGNFSSTFLCSHIVSTYHFLFWWNQVCQYFSFATPSALSGLNLFMSSAALFGAARISTCRIIQRTLWYTNGILFLSCLKSLKFGSTLDAGMGGPTSYLCTLVKCFGDFVEDLQGFFNCRTFWTSLTVNYFVSKWISCSVSNTTTAEIQTFVIAVNNSHIAAMN